MKLTKIKYKRIKREINANKIMNEIKPSINNITKIS